MRVIESAPPKEFDGPGNQWSPEQLLTAAVADCFVLGFRAIASASKFRWLDLEASTRGTLDKVEGKMRFTRFETHAKLHVPTGADLERAKRLLEKAESSCLVANSLSSERHLSCRSSRADRRRDLRRRDEPAAPPQATAPGGA